jgi:AAA domain-containing protein
MLAGINNAAGREFAALGHPFQSMLYFDGVLTMSVSDQPDDNFKTRFPDHRKPSAVEAIKFLVEIANHGDITIVCIPVGDGVPRSKTFDTYDLNSVNNMRSYISAYETQNYQVFYVANSAGPNCDFVPANKDIRLIRLVVFDIDPDKTKPFHEERARMRRLAYELLTGPLQPRAIIDTGNGMQVVYQLLEPIPATADNILVIESLMRAIARSIGADTATCTVKNLFRVPGTVNHPTPAKQALGRVRTVSGVWHQGGPKCSLADLQAMATVIAADEPASAPVEFDGLDEQDLIAVLGEPEALPGEIMERFRRDPLMLKIVQRPPPVGDTSGGDFYLCCALRNYAFTASELALILCAYGHKVETAFKQERLFSYVIHTVEKAINHSRVDTLLSRHEVEAYRQEEQEREKQHRARLKPMTWREALEGLFTEDRESIIEGMLGPGELVVLYGKPGSGKTFVALDIAHHVALGREWNQRRVKQSKVIYIATESPFSFRHRLKAIIDRHGPADDFYLVASTVNMFDPHIDMKPLIDEIAQIDGKIGLIVIDTLARAMIGGNENSTQDMSRLISNGDLLRDRFSAAVMWVHHSGKNEAAGARGSSALVAATDMEIEITDYALRSTKMRDREDIGYRFKLVPAVTGTTPKGDVISSCTVSWFVDAALTYGRNSPETNNLEKIASILRMRREPMTFKEILADAELLGIAFTVKQNSLMRALNRACESDVMHVFTRQDAGKATAKNQPTYLYGLVTY